MIPLSRQEDRVARLVAQGYGNDAIAQRMGITVGTVKGYLTRTYEKHGIEIRGEYCPRVVLALRMRDAVVTRAAVIERLESILQRERLASTGGT